MDKNKTFSLQEKFASWVMDLIVKAGVSKEAALSVKLVILVIFLFWYYTFVTGIPISE